MGESSVDDAAIAELPGGAVFTSVGLTEAGDMELSGAALGCQLLGGEFAVLCCCGCCWIASGGVEMEVTARDSEISDWLMGAGDVELSGAAFCRWFAGDELAALSCCGYCWIASEGIEFELTVWASGISSAVGSSEPAKGSEKFAWSGGAGAGCSDCSKSRGSISDF